MDPLRRDDVEAMRTASPEEKARQAFGLFRSGLRLKRAALRVRHPEATGAEIDEMVRAWLASGE